MTAPATLAKFTTAEGLGEHCHVASFTRAIKSSSTGWTPRSPQPAPRNETVSQRTPRPYGYRIPTATTPTAPIPAARITVARTRSDEMATFDGQRAAGTGGSIGGLTAALLLRDPASPSTSTTREPTARGSRRRDILQPETMRWCRERSSRRPHALSASSQFVRYLGPANKILYQEANMGLHVLERNLPRTATDLDLHRYHLGHPCQDCDTERRPSRSSSTAAQPPSRPRRLADGISSTSRRLLLPQVERRYANSVGLRGMVLENAVRHRHSTPERCAHLLDKRPTHMLISPMPGPNLTPAGPTMAELRLVSQCLRRPRLDELLTDLRGSRSDVSVPPGQFQDRPIDELNSRATHARTSGSRGRPHDFAPLHSAVLRHQGSADDLGADRADRRCTLVAVPTQQPELPRPPKRRGHLHRRLRSTIPVSLTHC